MKKKRNEQLLVPWYCRLAVAFGKALSRKRAFVAPVIIEKEYAKPLELGIDAKHGTAFRMPNYTGHCVSPFIIT